MKYLFGIIVLMLVVASLGTAWYAPQLRSDAPVLYWVTDPNPARRQQIALFKQWLARKGYPAIDLRVDAANNDVSKKIIQGVSGVAGDIIDTSNGGQMRGLQAVGILLDLSEDAERRRFDVSRTYPALEPEITVDGRQYTFPCNIATSLYWVNQATFARYDLPPPPKRWDFATFERLGKQFVRAANPPGETRTAFMANRVDQRVMRRSLGLSTFNETLTRCTLDDQRNACVLELIYKWTYQDRILPSKADADSFATESGFGGSALWLFNQGNYAMVQWGRYALIRLRGFGSLKLSVSELPCERFVNTFTYSRAAGIYVGSRHPDLAKYFLEYLADEAYNMSIVRDADGMGPNPVYTQSEAFLRPADYPNEWGCHEAFSEALQTIAIPLSYSPFILPSVVQRIEKDAYEAFMAERLSAERAGRQAAEQIDREIRRNLREKPHLGPRYAQLVQRQQQIDERRAQGEKVPLQWIENPFHRRYYQAQGWVE